jgi:nitronate monooxygenase
MYSDQMKVVLIDAGLNSTGRSLAFDKINRTAMWTEGIDGQAIANNILVDYYKEGLDLEMWLKKADEDKGKGKTDRLVIWAGVGVRHVKGIKGSSMSPTLLNTCDLEVDMVATALINFSQLQ